MLMDPAAARILDANFNRAREGLRVIEDYARFACDDSASAAIAKQLRHDLRMVRTALGSDALLAARDINGDVGRDAKTPGEMQRTAALDIVRAAFGRLTEALRTISEYAKLAAGDIANTSEAAAAAERIRYDAYELEQCLVLRGALRRRIRDCRLYVIITAALCRGDWIETAIAALRGGAACLQLREKSLADGELLHRARQLRDLTRRFNALLFVNDRPDIAALAHADGVHVGQEDLSARDVRRIAGGEMLVGVSSHSSAEFDLALAQAPDYIAVGPMFPSTTKPRADTPGLEYLQHCRMRTERSLVAIGGIDARNVKQIRDAGVTTICVCSAVIAANDPEAAARALA